MMADYQIELLDIAWTLSKYPAWDLLLFVKLYLAMKGDDLIQLEEAERALNGWSGLVAPQSWKNAVADPELHWEVMRKIAERHQPAKYTTHEIEEAIRSVTEGE